MQSPFFTIVTASYNDAWNLSKTIQSVWSQNQDLFEYIIINGGSEDGTDEIVDFWREKFIGNIQYIKEKDNGVYDAMNKGVMQASGQYICFMNAGDKFKDNYVLDEVKKQIECFNQPYVGLIGWGELEQEVYVPWVDNYPGYIIGTLGFCHQSVFLKTSLVKQYPFDSRKGIIDSDRLQLSQIIRDEGNVFLFHKVLSVRANDKGLSANSELLKQSSIKTMSEYYDDINTYEAEILIDFKYSLKNIDMIEGFLESKSKDTAYSIALMVIDVLVMKPKKRYIEPNLLKSILEKCICIIRSREEGASIIANIYSVVFKLQKYLEDQNSIKLVFEAKRNQLDTCRLEQVKTKSTTNIVVSLTSFPSRMKSLHMVLDSLFNQTIVPKHIYLYLAESQFNGIDSVSKQILDFQSKGLRIFFVKNIYQYKKYVFLQNLNRDMPVITIDDDVIYPPTMIEKLLTFHEKFPDAVVGNRVHQITYDAQGNINPYSLWKKECVATLPSHDNFATGVGGVLYPKNFIDSDCINERLILGCAPYADDVWLKINAIKRDIKVVSTDIMQNNRKGWYNGYTPEMRIGTLQDFNVDLGLNDIQYQKSLKFLNIKGVKK